MTTGKQLRARSGFTLAELLVVIAIIGLMFLVTLPMFGNIAGQTKLEAAANAVHSATKMARQYAIANNQPAYVVFNEGQTDPAAAYRAYAVFTINIHTNITPIPQEAGYFLTDWEMLPTGIVFDNSGGGSSNLFYVSTAAWNGGMSKYNELRIGNDAFIVKGFSPKGESGSASHFIFLAEGTVADDRPIVYAPGQGKQIRFSTMGKSRIVDSIYDESGHVRELGQ